MKSFSFWSSTIEEEEKKNISQNDSLALISRGSTHIKSGPKCQTNTHKINDDGIEQQQKNNRKS